MSGKNTSGLRPFEAGHEKVGGKKSTKGPSLRAIKGSVRQFLDEIDFSPIRELVLISRRKTTPLDLRIKALAEIAKYAHPKLSTVQLEHSGRVEHEHAILGIMADPSMAELAEQLSLGITAKLQADHPRLPAPSDVIELAPQPIEEDLL